MEMMGDKITARQTVRHPGVPVIPGSNGAVNHVSEIEVFPKTSVIQLLSKLPVAVVVKVYVL